MNKRIIVKRITVLSAVVLVLSMTFVSGAYASTQFVEWSGRQDFNTLVETLDKIGVKGASLTIDLKKEKEKNVNFDSEIATLNAELAQLKTDKTAAADAAETAKNAAADAAETAKNAATASFKIQNDSLNARLTATEGENTKNKAQLDQAVTDMNIANTKAEKVLTDLNTQ